MPFFARSMAAAPAFGVTVMCGSGRRSAVGAIDAVLWDVVGVRVIGRAELGGRRRRGCRCVRGPAIVRVGDISDMEVADEQ